MISKFYNVLFLCTGNSARSIMAEAFLNHLSQSAHRRLKRLTDASRSADIDAVLLKRMAGFKAYSAGSYPKGEVHPLALRTLERQNISTEGLRSKSWDEFAVPGAPEMDFVVTVCDKAAAEVCPVWYGRPAKAHWGVADPVSVEGIEIDRVRAFREAFRVLENRIKIFTNLPIGSLDDLKLQRELDRIGKTISTKESA